MESKTTAIQITRRQVLSLALASPFLSALTVFGRTSLRQIQQLDLKTFSNAPGKVIPVADSPGVSGVSLARQWKGPLCRSQLINDGKETVRVKEVVLFDLPLSLPSQSGLYGEGFQMLTQTGGTIGQPVDEGNYTDAKHYKIPAPLDTKVFYGLMTLTTAQGNTSLLGFTSCRRFMGQFYLRGFRLQVVVDTEGLEIKPGEKWELEEFTFRSGTDREQLLSELADRISENHKPLRPASPPTGWCSWYCFGSKVTAQQVLDNLDFIAKNTRELKYIQIDDGYQPAMGDWLETGTAFGGDVQGVLKQIRQRGFQPAIWVAPFIAEEQSHLFKQHRDWFVKDSTGKPLRSDQVTYGGWRHGPWYVLDGTHPEAQKHLEMVFRTMNRDWGCTYFKLDANFWGAIHGGQFHDPSATRIEAYRRGMQAVLRGAGDSFILGCNHPIWASLGVIHGSRSSNDIKRTWDRIKTTARQNLARNWQNGRLWWNDPDAVVLTGDLPLSAFIFHATAIYASGGMLLSGDDLSKTSDERLAILRKLIPPTGVPAKFQDNSLRVGVMKLPKTTMVCMFNWNDLPQTVSFHGSESGQIKDYWSGESLGKNEGAITIKDMPPHSARLFVIDRN